MRLKLVCLILVSLFLFTNVYAEEWTVDKIVEKNQKAFDICYWISTHIWYERDIDKWGVRDYWQSPGETLSTDNKFNKMCGDCEDFAILAKACLEKIGYECKLIYILLDERNAHVLCAIRKNGRWSMFDTAGFKNYDGNSIAEMLNLRYGLWEWAVEVDCVGVPFGPIYRHYPA